MPQMAPISWLILFLLFNMTLILFNMMNYYSYLPLAPHSKSLKTLKIYQMNWKW